MAAKLRMRNLSRDADLAARASVADTFWRGLLGRDGLEAVELPSGTIAATGTTPGDQVALERVA